MFRAWTVSLVLLGAFGVAAAAAADKQYGPGVSDTEIKMGQTAAYSGPASAYGTISKTQAAYVRMVNEHGGINGRKINLISLDDGYSPPKTVELTRRLIEEDRCWPFSTASGPRQMPRSRDTSTKDTCRISPFRARAGSTTQRAFLGPWG